MSLFSHPHSKVQIIKIPHYNVGKVATTVMHTKATAKGCVRTATCLIVSQPSDSPGA
jgi:hypothetical protein